MIESPTGSGKSLALINAARRWLLANPTSKVYYCSRRHQPFDQIANTIRQVDDKIRRVRLMGKDKLFPYKNPTGPRNTSHVFGDMSGPANGTPGKSSPQLPRGVLARSGTPFPPGARLPSLRAPRDLTLSGGAQKRTFAPNVSAPRRAPTKDNDSGPSVAEGGRPGRGGHRGGRGGERGRNRGRGKAQLIQTQGSTFRRTGLGKQHGGQDDIVRVSRARHSVASSDSSSAPERPKYIPSHTLTAKEKQEDDKRLALLLRSDFIDDGDQEASRLHPVTLPLACVKKEEEEDTKPVVVKKEKMDPDEEGAVATASPAIKVEPQAALARAPMAELCLDPNMPEVGQLLFFQFPDTLPGLVPEQQAPPKGKPGQGTNPAAPPPKAEPEQKEPGKRLTLADFPEGYVGKLQVLRSGRSRLLLGSVALTLERGTLVSFHQDLASLKATPEEGGGHLTILGQVPHKLICLPDVQALLGAYRQTWLLRNGGAQLGTRRRQCVCRGYDVTPLESADRQGGRGGGGSGAPAVRCVTSLLLAHAQHGARLIICTYFDHFFTTTAPMEKLSEQGVLAAGTLRTNRKDVPSEYCSQDETTYIKFRLSLGRQLIDGTTSRSIQSGSSHKGKNGKSSCRKMTGFLEEIKLVGQ
ncbi:hypothetical protein HPB47_019797 [Ixodes persulcatus]|uniref:Uncharacterized protein n=1 Tax=Ixodes persulcatus TaxID=34615 RepID=A0AC60QJP5_IXOPE|nr:hypothetical protein HPB47_019797 [Ixodes persulcatus]